MAARRQPDIVRVASPRGVFDRFQSLELTNDLQGQTEAIFEVGDDGAFPALERIVYPGEPFTVYLNGRLRMTGRAEVNEVNGKSDSGVVLTLTCRTKMSDARYSSAPVGIKVENTSVKDFVLACYAQLGLGADDFVFDPKVGDAELMTGKSLSGGKSVENVEPIQTQQAQVQPPETIVEAVDRHLKRFGAAQWELPDGRIAVGRPNDLQRPLYRLLAKRMAGTANNVLDFQRIRDWTDLPRTVRAYGQTYGKDVTSSAFKGEATDPDVDAVAARLVAFNRTVIVQDQQSKSADAAQRAAERELAQRLRRKDGWQIKTDGWSYWTGSEQIPWAPNTVADVGIDAVGAPSAGAYFILKTRLRLDINEGSTTELELVKPGTWRP